MTKAYVHNQNTDNQSAVSDWDITSIDRWNQSTVSKSTTFSMNNYLDMSTSVEVRAVKSDVIQQHSNKNPTLFYNISATDLTDANKRPNDLDENSDEHSGDTDLISFNQTCLEGVVASTSSKQSEENAQALDQSKLTTKGPDVQESGANELTTSEDTCDIDVNIPVDPDQVTTVDQKDGSVIC